MPLILFAGQTVFFIMSHFPKGNQAKSEGLNVPQLFI